MPNPPTLWILGVSSWDQTLFVDNWDQKTKLEPSVGAQPTIKAGLTITSTDTSGNVLLELVFQPNLWAQYASGLCSRTISSSRAKSEHALVNTTSEPRETSDEVAPGSRPCRPPLLLLTLCPNLHLFDKVCYVLHI